MHVRIAVTMKIINQNKTKHASGATQCLMIMMIAPTVTAKVTKPRVNQAISAMNAVESFIPTEFVIVVLLTMTAKLTKPCVIQAITALNAMGSSLSTEIVKIVLLIGQKRYKMMILKIAIMN